MLFLSGCANADNSTIKNLLISKEGSLIPLSKTPQSKQLVTIGLYINSIYGLNTTSNTYYLDSYLWLRWKGDTNPLSSLEFTNAVSENALVKKPLYEKPVVLSSGENYQVIRLQGNFFQPFNLTNYPLDIQELPIYVENSTDTGDLVSYLPDTESSGFNNSVQIPGWNLIGLSSSQFEHDYATDFGTFGSADAEKYSTLKFGLFVKRINNQFYWKLLFPLVIVLATCWLSLVISPELVPMRTGMTTSALLTTVFMHLSSKQEIPQVSSLVFMDKVFLLAYVCIVATLSLVVWINAHVNSKDEGNLKKMNRISLLGLAAEVIFFAGALLYLIASIPH